jgi:hypothetical protein
MRAYFGRPIHFNRYLYKQIGLNPNICQTFSLGILILSLADGIPPEAFYLPSLQMNGKLIGEAIGRLSVKGFSRLFYNLMRAMLSKY